MTENVVLIFEAELYAVHCIYECSRPGMELFTRVRLYVFFSGIVEHLAENLRKGFMELYYITDSPFRYVKEFRGKL